MTVYDHTSENVRLDCSEWPEAAQRAWLEAFDPGNDCWQADLVERGIVPWSRPTQYDRANVYTRYLRFRRSEGHGDAVDADGVRAWIDDLQDRELSLYTIASHVRLLYAVVALVYPEHDWRWLAQTRDAMAYRVKAANPSKRKDRHLYSTRNILRAGVELYASGVEALSSETATNPQPAWPAAQAVRDGLWLILGAHCPERVGSLQQVRLGELDLDRGLLTVPGERTKTRRASERTFPPAVTEAIRLYLRAIREPLVHAWGRRHGEMPHDSFWISRGGKPARPGTMAAAMRAATTERLGHAVSPHRLRDAAATYVVEEMPEQNALASAILRHQSSNTTREYMRKAEQVRAFRVLQQHVENHGESLR
jgi:integrase